MAAGQMALWPRRAIIYCNSGPVRLKEREGEAAWRALMLIRLPPLTPPITDNGWLAGCLLVRGRMGTGDKTVTFIYFFLANSSVSF